MFKPLFLFGCLLIVCMTACKRGNLYIDNPDSAPKKVVLDGNSFSVLGKGAAIVEAQPGVHKILIKDEQNQVLKDTVFYMGKAGLLKLAPARYVKWRELYGDEQYRKDMLNIQKVVYDTWEFKGDFTEYAPAQLYVEKDWDYDLDQPFPKGKVGWDLPNGQKYIIKSKIYRIADFVQEVKKK